MKTKLLLFLFFSVNIFSQSSLMNSFYGNPSFANDLTLSPPFLNAPYRIARATNVTALTTPILAPVDINSQTGNFSKVWKSESGIQMNTPLSFVYYPNPPSNAYTPIIDFVSPGYTYLFKIENTGDISKRGILMEFNKIPSEVEGLNSYLYNVSYTNPNVPFKLVLKLDSPLASNQYFFLKYRHSSSPANQYQWLPINFNSSQSLFSIITIPGISALGTVEYTVVSKSKQPTFLGDTEYLDSIYDISEFPTQTYQINQTPAPLADTTFKVNMIGQQIAEDGVFLQIGNGYYEMNPVGNNTYSTSITLPYVFGLPESNTYTYRFVNGRIGSETVPLSCRSQQNFNFRQFFRENTPTYNLPIYCFSSCNSSCSQGINVTFRVDTTGQTIGPGGVNLAGSFNGFSTIVNPMTNMGNNIYETTIFLGAGETVQYKFVNGSIFELVPNSCSVNDGNGNFNRTLVVPTTDTVLPLVCFNSCSSNCSPSSCDTPTQLGVSNITSNSALLTWTATNPTPTNGYDVFYNTTGNPPTSSTTPLDTSPNPFEGINNLIPNTVYYYWVRSNCGASTSNWVQAATPFTTNVFSFCNSADYGLFPTATFTPTCSGSTEIIATNAWASEYSNVNVIANKQYTFSSSVSTDFITITNQAGTEVIVSGQSPLNWYTNTFNGVVRYYIHTNSNCGNAQVNRTKRIACNNPTTAAVLFNVNMSNQTVSPSGVKLAGNFNGWSTTANPMTAQANGIYSVLITLPVGSVLQYKFVNGNNYEIVPNSCGVNDGNNNINRFFLVNNNGVTSLPIVCFNECGNCQTLSNTAFERENITIYPNPVKAGQTITISLFEDDTIKLFDLTGKLIAEKKVTVANPTFDIGSVSAGVYILRSKTGMAKIAIF